MTARGVARQTVVNLNPVLTCGCDAPDGVAHAHASRYGRPVTRSDRRGGTLDALERPRERAEKDQPDGRRPARSRM